MGAPLGADKRIAMLRAALVAAATLLVLGCAELGSGRVPQSEAVTTAMECTGAPETASFVSARLGPVSTFAPPGWDGDPERVVWAVTLSGDFGSCRDLASDRCRHNTGALALVDAATGECLAGYVLPIQHRAQDEGGE